MCACDVVHTSLQRQALDDIRRKIRYVFVTKFTVTRQKCCPRMGWGAAKGSWPSTIPVRSCHAQYKWARPASTFIQDWCRSSDVGRHASRRAFRFIVIGVALSRCGAVLLVATTVIHPPAVWVTTEQNRGISLVTWPIYANQVSKLQWFPAYELILAAVLVSVCLVGKGGRVTTLRHTLHHGL